MATTAPITSEPAPAKPSFAKVAASAYNPQTQKEPLPNAKSPTVAPHPAAYSHNMKPSAPTNGDLPGVHADKVEKRDGEEKAGNTAARTGQWADTAGVQTVPPTESKDDEPEKPRPTIALVKFSATEDSTTQLSSSDGSAKPPSIDGKSIASATTFALDEKESLRPDDSASLRAVEEEDVVSPPDSVTADSRTGSESGAARAFQSQLREIAVMGPQPQRGVPPGRFPNLNGSGPHTLYDPNQPPNGMGRPMSHPLNNGTPPLSGPQNLPAIPDEKLIEALQSPRDRLFVVKIEQDFIDFIKDSRESELSLPNCNTFYRMLAHRLADYYLLGHVVDSTMTGVKITLTPYCRIPPPLSQMVDSTKSTNTPPVDLPARKIMRRGDDTKSGTNTTANSENPSKTTSEVGGSDGGNDGNDSGNKEKDKTTLTREEREARYREARQRIFGSAESEENDVTEATGSGEEKEKDPSRSSSTTGKKKIKKPRNYDDDGFEARSRFNAYYPPQYPVSGYAGDNIVYYNGYPGQMPNPQFSSMNPNASPPPAYSSGYPAMMPPDSHAQYGWPNQQYQSPPNGPMMYPNYGPMQNGYDMSTDFQRGMQSFQSPGMPSQATPKLANAPIAPYQDSYQPPPPMPMNSGWPQMSQQPSYAMTQAPYAPNGPGNRPMSAPLQGSMPGSYPYGQFPPATYNGKPNRNQHPIPGSFNRQQFNPQSQAFVPGGRNMPFPMQPAMSQGPPPPMNGYGNFPIPVSNQLPNQMARPSPPIASTQSVPSPRSMQGNSPAANMSNIPVPPQTAQTVPSQSAPAPQGSYLPNPSSVSTQSSIAKYGTPSHLPAKPPAPVQTQPPAPKFNLPGHPFPPMSRVPSNMAPGLVNNSPVISIRGAAGPNIPNNNNNPN